VSRSELAGTGQIGDRPGDLQHAVVRPRREVEAIDSLAEHEFDRFMKPAVTSKISGAHVGIRVHPSLTAKANPLNSPSPLHSLPDS
jgi:hypothetical protein